MLGLVLTAGGARGAYQAGVLKRVAEIPVLRRGPSPFAIVAGASAGAINGALVAARSASLREATADIARLWSDLRVEHVFRSDALSLGRGALSLARDFVLGGLVGHTTTHGLLDTAPLGDLVRRAFPRRGIAEAIRRGHLHAVAVAATSYHSGRSFTFIEGRPGHAVWVKSRRLVLKVTLTDRHILASSAIPIVFPPVRVVSQAGDLWFGDGGLRLVAPMSPAIRLGATHVFAVGIRSGRAADTLAREELGAVPAPAHPPGPGEPAARGPTLPCPPLAQVFGVFMNAIFLDHLDADLDHLRRLNELAAGARGMAVAPALADAADETPREPMRVVTPCVVSPSEDLAMVAQRFAHRMPRLVRFAMDGLGTPDAQSADLMSYLLFDAAYTRTLVDIGYRDADQRIDEIEAFLAASGAFAASSALRASAARPARRPRRARAGPSAERALQPVPA